MGDEKTCKAIARHVNGDSVSLFRHDDETGGAYVMWFYTDQSPQLVHYRAPGHAAVAYVNTRNRWKRAGELANGSSVKTVAA